MVDLLGGKGANLAEMSRLDLPVPPGFTITTEACVHFLTHDRTFPDGLQAQVRIALAAMEETLGLKFGDPARPLLVSVRSGARVSMPGMMDTILNLGLNDETVKGLAAFSRDERFAWDTYRRFIQMYADVVLGIDHHLFEDLLEDYRESRGLVEEADLNAEDWREIVSRYKALVEEERDMPFPQDVMVQLWEAIAAVFASWHTPRARTFRQLHGIPEEWGTAVTVQAMVFGNRGADSATGVVFTRDPATGEKVLHGEYLPNAQGEDVVAGLRTPRPLTASARRAAGLDVPSLQEAMPRAFAELERILDRLERHFRDMQDVEFTIERGKVWLLQTRSGKRSARAAIKIAVDMVAEGLIDRREAVLRIRPVDLEQLLRPTIAPKAERIVLARGLPASPGAASGRIVFAPDEAERLAALGEPVILVRPETVPQDIHGMHAAVGILTTRGGMTSHAAVVARGMGRPCVTGAAGLILDAAAGILKADDTILHEGDWVTVDGDAGEVLKGRVAMVQPSLDEEFITLLAWADTFRRMRIRADAETPEEAELARGLGAEGIGLCRIDRILAASSALDALWLVLFAETEETRTRAADLLRCDLQRHLKGILAAMAPRPVAIRLLDRPLKDLMPAADDWKRRAAAALNMEETALQERLHAMGEGGALLDLRGVRLVQQCPDLLEMQAHAIFAAASEVAQESVAAPVIEIVVPFLVSREELSWVASRLHAVASHCAQDAGTCPDWRLVALIELPAAAFVAGSFTRLADSLMIDLDGLARTAFAMPQEEAGRILPYYLEKGLLSADPFTHLDHERIAPLLRLIVQNARTMREEVSISVCGALAGDLEAVSLFQDLGIDHLSCPPARIPLMRLAAARAALSSSHSQSSAEGLSSPGSSQRRLP